VIFLAVGTQLPFDRLVRTVDEWAEEEGGEEEVIGQVGQSSFQPRRIRAFATVEPDVFKRTCREASLLIAHAGMGSILGAMELRKPIVIMPRLADLGEHRNDHQLATARRFDGSPGVYVAYDVFELRTLLTRRHELTPGSGISSSASPELIETLRGFIRGGS